LRKFGQIPTMDKKEKFKADQREKSKDDLHRLRQKEKRSRIEKQIEARNLDEWQRAREKQSQPPSNEGPPVQGLPEAGTK